MSRLWLLALLLLVSCMRPHYEPQCVNTPEEWRVAADEADTLCNRDWWEQFQDPVLDDLIMRALTNNQDLQVAISRVSEYYARLGITNSALFPTITGNASFNRTQYSTAFPSVIPSNIYSVINDYQVFFNLAWELDVWGRIWSATAAAYADLLGQIEARRGVVITVVTGVANGYIRLRQLDSQLMISRNTLQSRMESLRLAQDRFELGETSEIEVKQAESEVEVAAIRVIQFEREIPIQENLLSVLLGENPHAIERGNPIESFQYPLTIPAGIPSELLTRRPDIVQAEDAIIAADARVTEARALFFPQINLTALYGNQSVQLSQLLTSPAEMWQYGFTAVQTLFDAGRIYFELEGRKAQRDQALFSYRQTILNAFREVNDSLISYKKNRELVHEHQRQVSVLSDYLHLAQLRYNEGEIDYLNVLDAERSLFNAQLDLVQAQSDSFAAVVKLYSALGGGWVVEADTIAVCN